MSEATVTDTHIERRDGIESRRRYVRLLVHAIVVAALGTGYVLTTYGVDEPNIGGGLFFLLLLPFGVPWDLLSFVGPIWSDAAVEVAAVGNLVLHAVLLGWLGRRHRDAWRHRHLWAAAVLCAVPLAVASGFGVASQRAEAALRARATTIMSVSPWTADGIEIDDPGCWFCGPTSLGATATQLGAPLPPERVLFDRIDAQLRRSGLRTSEPWGCDDITDAPPQRRVCAHGADGVRYSALVRIYYFDNQDPQLWLDLNQRP